ncbi:hypothetical protein QQ008_00170 [Fulvivirgaceae bacterium BMA10]|uniref:Uncharacterized protein n=1 Tax=Splendidivirga corallicola TaxID=3051826 RepID=A0ABT8KI75_9BACT|nr:hypothetical protein [Fulvivirgaceae bacterium BMA10]
MSNIFHSGGLASQNSEVRDGQVGRNFILTPDASGLVPFHRLEKGQTYLCTTAIKS